MELGDEIKFVCCLLNAYIINRHGVGRVVLQRALSLIPNSFADFASKSSTRHYSQTIRARKLKF